VRARQRSDRQRRDRTRRLVAIALLVVLGGVVAGAALSQVAPGPLAALRDRILPLLGRLAPVRPAPGAHVEGISGEPLGLNPLLFTDSASQQVAALLFDGMTRLDNTNRVQPALAVSWEAAPGNRIWTFRLRPDAVWHDGQAVTARDVTFTLNNLAAPDMPGEAGGEWLGVVARYTDDLTVVVELPLPDAAFPVRATVPVLPRHILSAVPLRSWYEHEFARRPVGTGPFVLVEWRAGSEIELVANASYYLGTPGLPAVVCRFFEPGPGADALPAFGLGAAAFTGQRAAHGGSIDPAAAAQVAALRDLRVITQPWAAMCTLMPNERRPAGEAAVRQAVALTLDLGRVAAAAHGKLAEAGLAPPIGARGLAPLVAGGGLSLPGSPGDAGFEQSRRDVERARQLLSGAGWRDSDGDAVLDRAGARLAPTLLIPTERPDLLAAAGEIAAQLAPLGISVEVRQAAFAEYLAAWAPPFDFDWALVEWYSPPGQDLYELLHSSQQPWIGPGGILRGGANFGGINDAVLDQALTSLRAIPLTAETERMELFAAVNRRVAAQAHLMVLWREVQYYACPADLEGPAPGAYSTYWNAHVWRRR